MGVSYDFTIDGYEDPGPDVLDNGLPPLPETIEVTHGVAVARWVDGDFGVVLCVYRNDPADEPDEESFYEYGYDVQPYQRINGSWESSGGSGGSNWHSPPFERYPGLSRFTVSAGHIHQQQSDGAPPIRVVDGLVGEGVVSIETVHRGRTHAMPIESPIGAWVAGVVGDGPAQWVARDAAGRVAASGEIDSGETGIPGWMALSQETLSDASAVSEDGMT